MTSIRAALPWYVHPAEDPRAWQLLAARAPRPSFVVVNVFNGPGEADDPWYPAAVEALRGIRLMGYVDLAYGQRPVVDVVEDVRAWLARYRMGGVMLDQVPADAASIGRCADYVRAARRAGAGFVVGNPGVEPQLAHVSMFDVTCVFEGDEEAYAAYRPSARLSRVPRSRVWHLVHSCRPERVAGVTARAALVGAGHAFVTDRPMPHPWGGFPLSDGAAPVAAGTGA